MVAWREVEHAAACLQSLASMEPRPEQLLCVAMQVSDAQLSRLEARSPTATRLLSSDENLGFAAAASWGISAAVESGSSWVLLMNNDAVVEPECLAACLSETSSASRQGRRVGLVSPAVVYADRPEVVWYGGGRWISSLATARFEGRGRSVEALGESRDTEWAPFCCVLLAAEAWREVGPLNPDYFLYFEDVEWCLRAKKAGWTCRLVARPLARHAVSASSGGAGSDQLTELRAYYRARNPLLYARATRTRALRWSRTLGLMFGRGGYFTLQALSRGRISVVRQYLRGERDAFAGVTGPRPEELRS